MSVTGDIPASVIQASHAENVKRYNVPGSCKVVLADWPYDCDAKRKHPDHVVFVCETHSVWWHTPDWQPADVPAWA